MTALDPVFAQIVEAFADGIPRPVPAPRPEFREAVRLVIELEPSDANEDLISQIEALVSASDRYGNAGIWREHSETAICVSCHDAMPDFHTDYHNCQEEAI